MRLHDFTISFIFIKGIFHYTIWNVNVRKSSVFNGFMSTYLGYSYAMQRFFACAQFVNYHLFYFIL